MVRVRSPWEEAVFRGHQSDEKDPGAQRASPLRSREKEQRSRERPGAGMVVGRGPGQKMKPESQAETSPLVALEWSCPASH